MVDYLDLGWLKFVESPIIISKLEDRILHRLFSKAPGKPVNNRAFSPGPSKNLLSNTGLSSGEEREYPIQQTLHLQEPCVEGESRCKRCQLHLVLRLSSTTQIINNFIT